MASPIYMILGYIWWIKPGKSITELKDITPLPCDPRSHKAIGAAKKVHQVANFVLSLVEQGIIGFNEWKETLLEAATTMPAKPLRDLFTHILFHNEPTDLIGLWNLVIDDATGRTLKSSDTSQTIPRNAMLILHLSLTMKARQPSSNSKT